MWLRQRSFICGDWKNAKTRSRMPNRGPPQITKRFQQLTFAGVLREAPPDCWAQDLDQTVLKGNCFVEELAFYHKKSRTLIMTDFIQNHPTPAGRPILNVIWRLAGAAYPSDGTGQGSEEISRRNRRS